MKSPDYSVLTENFKKKELDFEVEYKDITISNCNEINDKYVSEYIQYLESDMIKIKGIFIGNKLIGVVGVKYNKVLAFLRINKEYRGYGLSKELVRIAVEEFGADTLGVYCDNEVAIRLYKEFGFYITLTAKNESKIPYYIMGRKGEQK